MEEVRVMLFPNTLLAATNVLMPEHLKLSGFLTGPDTTGIPLLSFLFSITYIGSLDNFDQEVIRDIPITSMVIVSGIVLKVDVNNAVSFFAEGQVNLTPYDGETFIVLPDTKLTVDIIGETTTIRVAESLIDLSTAPNITPQMMAGFNVYNVKSWTQLAHIDIDTWLAFGGVDDFDAYQDTIMYAASAAQAFWETL